MFILDKTKEKKCFTEGIDEMETGNQNLWSDINKYVIPNK